MLLVLTTFFLIIIALMTLFEYRKMKNKQLSNVMQKNESAKLVITSHDIRAIAGEDMIATQLDLARAYIEIGKKQLAKKILEHTLKQGTSLQQQQAQQLLDNL